MNSTSHEKQGIFYLDFDDMLTIAEEALRDGRSNYVNVSEAGTITS